MEQCYLHGGLFSVVKVHLTKSKDHFQYLPLVILNLRYLNNLPLNIYQQIVILVAHLLT